MQTATTPGGFCDVAFYANGLYVVTMTAGEVIVSQWASNAFAPIYRAPCEGNGFPRLTGGDRLWLAYRPQSGQEVVVVDVVSLNERRYPGIFYNWPTALGVAGYAVNSFGTGVCQIWNYDGTPATEVPALPGTGIAYLDGQNQPVSIDDNRGSQPGMLNPERTDGLIVGEGMTGGVPCLYKDTITKIIAEGTYAYVPKLAKHLEREEWAIVTTDYGTVTLYHDITAADFEDVTIPPGPVEPPTIPVPPVPPAYTHQIFIESGESVLTTAVERRTGPMLVRINRQAGL